jgi:transposase
LFDRQNLAEIVTPDYPGERLIACLNPLMAERRRRKRAELLAATERELHRIAREVTRRTQKPLDKGEIGLKVGRVLNRYKVGKHFKLTIEDGTFEWRRDQESIQREAALDGIYVIRTSETKESLSAEDAVRQYKSLSQVERLFRTLKGIDLRVRPIRHHTVAHVRAHIFLCVLAYYVEWHLRQALASLLFDDEELNDRRKKRDPVAPAKPSASARRKKAQRLSSDGLPIHSFETLLGELGTRSRNRCRVKSDLSGSTFDQVSEPSPLHARVLELIALYPVQ